MQEKQRQRIKVDRLKQEKAKIRRRILTLLKKQEESERITKSRSIEKKLFSLPEFIQAKCAMFYVSFDGEVETITMIKHAQQMGKEVAVPVIHTSKDVGEEKLIASLLKNVDNQLSPGPYGSLQPNEADVLEVALEEINLVVVPGVAFDKEGNRLGRGKGYYDRFLKDLAVEGIPSVGIAFDFQVVDSIPTLSHDLPVTKLIFA